MNRTLRFAILGFALLMVGAGLSVTGTSWACPSVVSNDNPSGPTALPDCSIGKEQVAGQVTVAGGGGMSPVQFSTTGQAQSGGLSGSSSGTTTGTAGQSGDVNYSGALGTVTGTVTQTSPTDPVEVIPDPSTPFSFSRGTFLSGGTGRYITPPSGTAPGAANFNSASAIQFLNGGGPVTPVMLGTHVTNAQINGDGIIKGSSGSITGGRPVAGTPVSGQPPAGQPLNDANVRYGE